MKLWDKGYTVNNLVDKFTVGKDRELDLKLAKYDVLGNFAHAKMLHKIGVFSDKEIAEILTALNEIKEEVASDNFIIEEQFEDVHSKIEFELVQKIGEAGKKIHTARSRNDQVLVDLHLYAKDEINEIKGLVKNLFHTLIQLSDKYKEVIIPGYTHMQVAMPSSFGLWFGAYAEILIDDIVFLNAAFNVADQNPLGSAAGYGSSLKIDRDLTTELLGFKTMKYNVVSAQMSRGKLEKSVALALSSVAGTLSKMASDICLYMCQNFDFLGFPKELTTGSSIMPHKQNPDVFELVRAKANKIQSLVTELIMLTNNLTSGYHRDFQLLKESFMNAIDETKNILEVSNFMMQHIEIIPDIIEDKMYDYMYSVENLNHLVNNGATFREAYQIMGKEILEGKFEPFKEVNHIHKGSIGNLCLDEIVGKFEETYLHFNLKVS